MPMYRISRNLWLSIACGSIGPALTGPPPLFAQALRVTPRFPHGFHTNLGNLGLYEAQCGERGQKSCVCAALFSFYV
jgi:hypothetical protein